MNAARQSNEILRESLERLARVYADAAEQIFSAAAQAEGEETFCFASAGLKIHLRVAGRKIAPPLTAAFRHLEEKRAGEPDLTLLCWDNSASGRKLPAPDGLLRRILEQADYQRLEGCRAQIFLHDWMRLLSGFDLEGRRAFYAIENLEEWPHCERAMPMKHLLNPLFNRHGRQLMHAAAVGTAAGSLLITAPGGRGKSSTALTAWQQGLLYAADDICLVSGGEAPRSYSLYSTAKLRREGVGRFPALASRLISFQEFGEGKAYFNVHEHEPATILRDAPIRAILYPRITGEKFSRVLPANRLEVMRDSLPSTLQLVPPTNAAARQILTQLYARVPVYHLLLGEDREQLAAVLRDLLPG